MKKHVLILTTGGTIVSADTDTGLRPLISSEQLRGYLGDLDRYFSFDIQSVMNLDSSNIQAEEWQVIAQAVYDHLEQYDGIVITHGTDTMAYTASALSFMLQNLKKPVVLTGSQIPISHLLTDARNNLYTAFSAVENQIPGVSVAFDHKIIRGCRAVKIRTLGFEAFESINAPYLGVLYADGMHRGPADCVPAEGETRLLSSLCSDVFLLKLIPGTKPEIFGMLRQMKYRGIVLETFGAGGMHFLRRNLLPELKKLTDSGISVAACSQCLYDTSDFSIYEVGIRLLECGIIPAHDMTTEAVVTKMMWALGQTDDPKEVVRMFQKNYAGEISIPHPRQTKDG